MLADEQRENSLLADPPYKNIKGSSSGLKEVISDGNLILHEEH